MCQGRKLAGHDAVRGKLRAIRAAMPTVFRYCSAHGTLLSRREAVLAKQFPSVAKTSPDFLPHFLGR